MRYLLTSLIKIVVVSVAMGAGALWLDTVVLQMAGTGVLAQLFALLAAMAGAGRFLLCCCQLYGDYRDKLPCRKNSQPPEHLKPIFSPQRARRTQRIFLCLLAPP